MKKIIAVVLIGFSIMTCFVACGDNSTTESTSIPTISYATALSYQREQPEDCYFSSDGKTFYRVRYYTEDGRPANVEEWAVKN